MHRETPCPRTSCSTGLPSTSGTFRAVNRLRPAWSLFGTDIGERNILTARNVPGVVDVYPCQPDEVPDRLSVISMLHVLEHIPDPGNFLARLKVKLDANGLLIVLVPDYLRNPFDLVVADHAIHFDSPILIRTLQGAGFEVLHASREWIHKEICVVARAALKDASGFTAKPDSHLNTAGSMTQWLIETAELVGNTSRSGKFGLFGTGIAGCWLFGQVGESVEFFVDEDPCRVGKEIMKCPVIHPSEVPGGSKVFMATGPEIAPSIVERLARPDLSFILPPPLPT